MDLRGHTISLQSQIIVSGSVQNSMWLEGLHSRLLNVNATVVDFLISPSLTVTLSQAWVFVWKKRQSQEGTHTTLIKKKNSVLMLTNLLL